MDFNLKLQEKLSYKRAASAIGGAAGISVSNLFISLLMISKTSQVEYGVFALLLVIQSLANGFSNALLNSPLLIVITGHDEDKKETIYAYHKLNFLYCLFVASIQFIISYELLHDIQVSALFLFLAFFSTFRWFGRAFLNNCGNNKTVVNSDFTYTVLMVVCTCLLLYFNIFFLVGVLTVMLLSNLGATLLFNGAFMFESAKGIRCGHIDKAKNGFLTQGRFAAVGVISAEATSNSHAYIVTFLFGPAAFATIAAANLLFRPLDVIFSTLTQIERPRIRRLIAEEKHLAVHLSIKKILCFSSAAWVVVFVLGFFVNDFVIERFFTADNEIINFEKAFYLFLVVYFLRVLRNPLSIYLQSSDNFRLLSSASLRSGLLTVTLVLFVAFWMGSVESLLGVICGEVLLLLTLYIFYRKRMANV